MLSVSLLLSVEPFFGESRRVTTEPSDKADFHVSTVGSDDWSGLLSEPDARRTDGPFASLDRARRAVREMKGRGSKKNAVVLIRKGLYRLSKTVVFGPEDSGRGDSTVTYAAWPGEKAVFSAGVEIRGWRKLTARPPGLPEAAVGKVWVADVPRINGAPWRFHTLYDAEGLLRRARSDGFVPTARGKRDVLHFPKGKLRNWPNLEDVDIVIRPHHAWVVNILPLLSVNEKTNVARTAIPGTYALNELHFLKGTKSCWVENVIEALDKPGEWVLNSKEGKLLLWPRGQTPPCGVTAPRLRELVRVEGLIDKDGPKDSPVRNIRFRGLTFTHGERDLLTSSDAGLQHDWEMHDKANAMVRLRGAENCAIEQCRFVHGGGTAIRIDLHGRSNRIAGNRIEHIGGTGVLLCGYGPGTKDVNKKNLVYNNHIHHIGEIHPHSPGIMVWQSGANRIANNLIRNTPYAGIILSGVMTDFFSKGDARELVRTIRWREIGPKRGGRTAEQVRPFLHTRNNIVEYNEIHHAMEQLADGNAIYIRGAGRDNVIRRNYIHHLLAPTSMQAAIRTDGGQRDTLIAENLIYKCVSQGIKLKLNNRAENNVIADLIEGRHCGKTRPVAYLALREGPMTGAAIKRNILYHSGSRARFYDQGSATRRRKPALSKDADTDFNIYYCAGSPELGSETLARQQRDGVDARSMAVDPLFVDPARGDFRLKPNSPALKLGIIPIDLSKIGLRKAR